MDKSRGALRDVRYPGLTRFLLERPEDESRIAVSLLVVQSLLEETLPVDALLPSWWQNDPYYPHCRSWLNAGWEVEDMNPGRGVAFVRTDV